MERITRMMPMGGSSGKITFRTIFSYVFDYGIIVIFAIIYAALDKIVSPFAQRFSMNDITIQYPFAEKERIPIAYALVLSAGFPLVIIALYTLVIDGLFSHSKQKGVSKYTFGQRMWELNCGILGLLLAQGAAFCITGTLKNLIGRPRPDLIDRCIPPLDTQDGIPFGLVTKEVCTRDSPSIMQDAFRSFPSGHSSSSFAGLGYLSLYLSGKLHVLDQRGEVWRTVIVLIPLVAASCIAASRIMDYRHHPEDVLIGSLLGLLCAWGAYRQYFPPLGDSWMKGRAYPMRDWGVPVKKPEDRYGAGYDSGRVGGHGDAEEIPFRNEYVSQQEEEHQMYNMGPVRGQRADLSSPGFEHITAPHIQVDDTDYEMVRPKLAPGINSQTTGGTNVFREQISKNQSQKRPTRSSSDNEEDIGVGNRI